MSKYAGEHKTEFLFEFSSGTYPKIFKRRFFHMTFSWLLMTCVEVKGNHC